KGHPGQGLSRGNLAGAFDKFATGSEVGWALVHRIHLLDANLRLSIREIRAHQSHQWLRSRSRLTTGDTADYQSALRGSADCQSAVSRTGSPHEPALCQWPFGPRTTDDTTTLPLVDSLSPRRRSGERVREKGFQFAAPIRRKEPLSPALSPLVPRGEREQGASMMVVVIRSKRVLKTDNLW